MPQRRPGPPARNGAAEQERPFRKIRRRRRGQPGKRQVELKARSLMMEFHIARSARERYGFAESLFSYTGNVVFANVAACREFAHRMNQVRDVEKPPDRVVHAGQLYAMGLIDEASHVLMARYREQFDAEVMTSALDWFSAKVGADERDGLDRKSTRLNS